MVERGKERERNNMLLLLAECTKTSHKEDFYENVYFETEEESDQKVIRKD